MTAALAGSAAYVLLGAVLLVWNDRRICRLAQALWLFVWLPAVAISLVSILRAERGARRGH